MATVKIAHNSPSKANPSELENSIAQALFDLETQVGDLKAALRPLQFYSAREVEVGGGKKAIIILVSVPLLPQFQKVQLRLTRELEKKFSDRHVIFLGRRIIIPPPSRRSRITQKRPRSRTLTAVHEALLHDLVYPTEIVGKRVRTRVDGHKITKVFLDAKEKSVVDFKVETFSDVYKKLTGKQVTFEFGGPGAEY